MFFGTVKGTISTSSRVAVWRCKLAQAKIELRLGSFQFTGEADAAWLEKQLDKVLEHIKSADPSGLSEDTDHHTHAPIKQHKTKETLSAYLKSSGANASQVKKFLATACWLTAKGSERLTTGEVTKALSDNRQGKLANPSDVLNQNVTKGLCEKDGKQFYVTEEGFTSLGKKAE
jgi:hypothetical protein